MEERWKERRHEGEILKRGEILFGTEKKRGKEGDGGNKTKKQVIVRKGKK